MNSSERIEEMICDLEGCRWDAVLLNETWRPAKSDLGNTSQTHIHGNRKIRQQTRSWNSAIMVNHQRIKLMSVYFTHSGYADHHVEKMCRTIEKHTITSNNCIPIVAGDFNAELGPGYGVECASVGPHTHSMKETKVEIC